MPKRPILLALLVAGVATLGFVCVVRTGAGGRPARGRRPGGTAGRRDDARRLDRSTSPAYAGKPVVINFWGPSCVPCRDEFPLLEAKVAEHAADGLTVVGVLTDDPVDPARDS